MYPYTHLWINVPNINDCTSYLRGCQDPKPSGCSSFLGLERSGEECAAAVDDIVYLLLERHRAGTRPAPTGPGRWKRESTRDQGRHKACPYRSAAVEEGVDAGPGQAQGLPLPVRGGRRGSRRGTRAGTRPAPTGPRRWKGESTRDQGRHKACPYRSAAVEEGVDAGPGQAQGLPLPVRGGRRGSRRGTRAGTRPAPTGPGRSKRESTRD